MEIRKNQKHSTFFKLFHFIIMTVMRLTDIWVFTIYQALFACFTCINSINPPNIPTRQNLYYFQFTKEDIWDKDRELVQWLHRKRESWHQSILKISSCSLEGLKLKLKLQYFGHLMRRANWFEKTLMLGKIKGRRIGGNRGWDGRMASPTQWTWVWVGSGSWCWTGRPGLLQLIGS